MNRIAVTMGDPAGIGGELVLRAYERFSRRSIPVIVGDLSIMETVASRLFEGRRFPMRPFGCGSAGDVEVLDVGAVESVRFGISDSQCGEASYRYIMKALGLVFSGEASAVVTCPINKKSIQAAGVPFVGHTELLAHYAGVTDYVMMMAARRFRVSLATIHVPLREVPPLIDRERVFRCIAVTARSRGRFRAGRAPHQGMRPQSSCGEQGVMGTRKMR